jgi:hypothetical protein
MKGFDIKQLGRQTQNLTIIVTAFLVLAGCSKPSGDQPLVDQPASNDAQQACDPSAAPLDMSKLAIQSSSGQVGEKVNLSLNQDVTCANGQKVTWSSQNKVIGQGGAATTSFKTAGNFAVTAEVVTADQTLKLMETTTVVADQPAIKGPQVGFSDQLLSFELVVPAAISISSVDWSMGDGSPVIHGGLTNQFVYFDVGSFSVTATAVDSTGTTHVVTHQLQIIPFQEGPVCDLSTLSLLGPVQINRGESSSFSTIVPSCLTSVSRVEFNFGDSSSNTVVNSPQPLEASHVFASTGSYTVTVALYNSSSTTPILVLTREVTVVEPPPVPTPTPEPTPEPTPTPVVHECSVQGETRELPGETSSRAESCGLNGSRQLTEQVMVHQVCSMVGDTRKWVEGSVEIRTINTGACEGQSCQLMVNGSTETILDGGTKTSVVTGEIKEAVQCEFNEEGISSSYQQLSDYSCKNGDLVLGAVRKGNVITAGICPQYSWTGSDVWSQCSADCGGTQSREFKCLSSNGAVADVARCTSVKPTEARSCDGNPDAVKRSESSVTQEEAPSCSTCPKNQIGIIVKNREVTTTLNYACKDHSVQLISQETKNGAWVEESYCRDYVAHRCNQDSLSNSQAKGRYAWMVKCQGSVPTIQEFLEKMNAQKGGDGRYGSYGINSSSRSVYPTFMQRVADPKSATGTKEAVWIAPKSASANCVVPESAYVAAVCLSSCVTPEQQILAAVKGKPQKMAFIDALLSNQSQVATLRNNSSISDRKLVPTKVDQWVSELIDTEHDILVFKMESGGELKVTPNHPVLSEQGMMKLASEFAVGEHLVQLGGHRDLIVGIEKTKHFGKVYNVFVKSNNLRRNVVVTGGYLNGTAFYQNEGAVNMNRALFRKNLVRGAVK